MRAGWENPICVLAAALLLSAAAARADSVVVFNEIMYHPLATNEAASEWVELRNQMCVDVDISRWQLAGAVQFAFPEGTIIPAGGFMVVAASPATLAAAGVTNVLGPLIGRLGNGGATVQLKDNNDRLMDEVSYGTDGAWPIAPDGAGPSLARRAVNLASADAASWRSASQVGGSPSSDNFPVVPPVFVTNILVPIDGIWKWNNQGTDLGSAWSGLAFDDSGWSNGAALFYKTDASLPAPKNTALSPVRPTTYFRTQFVFEGDTNEAQLAAHPLVDDGAVVYLNGIEVLRLNMPAGPVSFTALAGGVVGNAALGDPITLPPGSLSTGTNVLAVEVHQAAQGAAYPQAVFNSGPVGYWRLGEAASPVLDSALAYGPPQAGSQNGSFTGFISTNLATDGPRPVDSVGGMPLAGFDANNCAPHFAGNTDGGDDVVTVADPGVFNFATNRQFTLEAWVKGAASQESGAAIICRGAGGGGEQYCLDVFGGTYRFFIRDSSGAATVLGTTVAPNNTWQHVVAAYDQPAGRMKFYLNGVESGSATPRATLLNMAHEVSIGARQNTGSVNYDLNFDGRIDEAAIYSRALSATEILAHYNAAFASSAGAGPDTNDVVFGLQLTSCEAVVTGAPALKLAFNEVTSVTNSPFWLELINCGTSTADLNGCVVARFGPATNREYVFARQTLAPAACLQVTETQLGFRTSPGDKLILYAPDRASVLDAVLAGQAACARQPDGQGRWLHPAALTPGQPNVVDLRDDVVINEIMYHPRGTNESWLELFNRATNVVDLTGWSLAGGISYGFATGQTLAPGGYLVVAKDVAGMQSIYPGLDVVGPFINKLSKSSDWLSLRDAAGNPVNELRYFDSGRWHEYADGGGSSLELRDPRADNAAAETWAASDESAKAPWQTYKWRGIAAPGQANEPDLWHEFALCLLDGAGEVLLDDVSVIASPGTAPKQLIQNGGFNGGSAARWRLLGTHRHSRVEPEPGNPANYVLHLVATGPGEYQGNQIETTLTNNIAVNNGLEYEISFRARWLAGSSLLNSRLYFNRLARTVQLVVPAFGGTPGAVNSRFSANIGPTFNNLAHWPVIPNANELVAVSVDVRDPDGIAFLNLKYSVNGGAWQSIPMSFQSLVGHASASVPGQPAGSIVQFFVGATDELGAVSAFPPGGTNSRALWVVQDGQAASGPLHNLRVIMTRADATWLHTGTNTLSNELLGCTVVSDEQDVFYDAGVRLKGSFVGRNVARVGFHIRFQPDRLFRGVHDNIAVDRSGSSEIMVKHLAGHGGGIPNMYDDLAWFIAPLPSYTSLSELRLAGFGDLYLDSQFENGSDGPMHEPETLRWELNTVDGNPESPKIVGNESAGTGFQPYDLQDYGANPEAYRWSFPLVNGLGADDLSAAIDTCKLFSLTGTNFAAQAPLVLDVDEWCRVLAFQSLIGPADAFYTGGTYHNYRLYRRPQDARVLYLMWDWDSCFMNSPTASLYGIGNVAKLFQTPAWNRAYLNHLYDLVSTTFNTTYAARWTAHYGGVGGQDFSSVLSYIAVRASHVLGRLPTGAPFAITSNGGANFTVTNGLTSLSGVAPIAVDRLEVNGTTYGLSWTSTTNWTVAIPLNAGINSLSVLGLDQRGNAVANATDTIIITNTGAGALLPVVINEWMADNKEPGGFPDPADGLFQDWFELYNPNTNALNLSGLFLTDNLGTPGKWQIPTNTFISALGFLIVWADGNTSQNPLFGGTNLDLHANFQLNNDGEAIGLFSMDGVTPLSTVTFGPQIQNVSQGRFVDGDTDSIYFMTNWTPGAANTIAGLSQPRLLSIVKSNNVATLVCEVLPGRTYQLQFTDSLTPAVWFPAPLATSARSAGSILTLRDPLEDLTATRYYRLVLLQ